MKMENKSACFSTAGKVWVTDYSSHNLSYDGNITLWTIDASVTEEIAISASSLMDFSLMAVHENGPQLFRRNSNRLKTNI